MRLIGYRLRTFPFSLKGKEQTGEVMGRNGGCGRMRSRAARASGTAVGLAAVVLVQVGTAGAGWERLFAPKADLWPRWQQHDPADMRAIDHRPWHAFLGEYLDTEHPSGLNPMNYRGVTPEDPRLLETR